MTTSPAPTPPRPWWRTRSALAALAAVVVFAVTAILVWQLDSGSSGDAATTSPGTVPAGAAATIVSAEQLRSFASGIGRPVYWAGERPHARIEYTQTADGTTYVRYLTGAAQAGDKGSRYVVVATYAQPDAYARVRAVARRNGYRIERLQNSGIAVTEPRSPRNVHIVYPGLAYQVEVYAPLPAQARQIALSGAVAPVG